MDFVDNLLHLKWQKAVKDLWAARDPIEAEFFDEQASIEEEAMAFFENDPAKAEKFLTDLTQERMEEVVEMYRALRRLLITKYTNNTY